METGLLNETQAAEILAVKVPTLRVWRWKRQGPKWHKIGRLCRYSRADLDAYINAARIDR